MMERTNLIPENYKCKNCYYYSYLGICNKSEKFVKKSELCLFFVERKLIIKNEKFIT
jgi:hypothetical protein